MTDKKQTISHYSDAGLMVWEESDYPEVSIEQEYMFTLYPERDDEYGAASRSALIAYGQYIRCADTPLSDEISKKIEEIFRKLGIYDGPKSY